MNSRDVIQKVVEMKFDNAQFEKNAQTSMSTIDDLKKSLNFSGMSDGLGVVGQKFSALETVAVGALMRIGSKIADVGMQLTKSLAIDPIKEGFGEYELKMGSIQTIMAGSGASLDTVMQKLNDLNTYSDKTIYSFSDMTNSIGKFTNAGVDLDTAVSAIQGVANVAAVSGANAGEASRAMYNFAQALSSGYVKLIDWKSIENANMATVEFKNQLLEAAVAAGTVEKTADGMYQVLTTNAQGAAMKETIDATKNFNDSLAYQWMTTDVLTSTLGKYADETTDIGKKAFAAAQDVKTFSQLMDTLKEAVGSGWAETFENIFGNFEEAKSLWTNVNNIVSDIIGRQADARNALLAGWKEAGGRDDLMDSLLNLLQAFSDLNDIVGSAAKEIFSSFFADTETGAGKLKAFTARIKEFTESLKLTDDETGKLTEKGEKLKSTLRGIFAAIGIVVDIAKALFKSLIPGFSGLGGDVLSTAAGFGEMIVRVREAIQQSGVLEGITKRLGGVFKALNEFIGNTLEIFRGVSYWEGGGGLAGIFESMFDGVNNVVRLFFDTISSLTGIDLSKVKDKVISAIQTVRDLVVDNLGPVSDVLGKVKNIFTSAFEAIKKAIHSIGPSDAKPAQEFVDKTEETFSPLKTFFEGVKSLFKGVAALFQALSPIFQAVISATGKVMSILGNAVSDIVHNFDFSKLGDILSNALKVGIGVKLFGFIDKLKHSVDGVPGIVESVKTMFDGIGKMFKSFGENAKAKKLETQSIAIKNIAVAIGILAAALFVLSSIDSNKLQSSMTVVTILLGELIAAIKILEKTSKKANLKKIASTMIGLSASVLILSIAMSTLGSLDSTQIADGLLAITALMVEMVAAAKILGSGSKKQKMMQGAANAVIFALAIDVLASAVKKLAKLNPESMGYAVMAVSLLLIEMVGAAKILGNSKDSSSMMKGAINAVLFAQSIKMLASAVKSLGKLNPAQLVNGMIGVTILLAEMVVAAKLLGNNKDSSSMMKGAANAILFAAALRILVSSVKALGKLSVGQLAKGLVGITALLAAMVVAANAMKGSLGGSAAMLVAASALITLSVAMKILGTLSWSQVAKGLIVLAGAFTILGVAGYVLGPVIKVIFALAGALALIGLSSVLFGAGIMMIAAGFAALGASTLVVVDSIIKAIIRIIEAIPQMIAALAKSIKEAATSIIECLVEIIKIALASLKQIIPEAVDVLLELILSTLQSLASNTQPIIEALLDIVVGVIRGLGTGLPEIITATIDLLKSIIEAIIGAFDGLNVADMLEATAALTLFAGMMTLLGVISVAAIAVVAPLPFIGKQLSKFIEEAQPFLDAIQKVDPASLQGAKAMAEMILILTANGVLDALTSWFTGGSSMVDFGKQLTEFAPYLVEYANTVSGITASDVEASANAAKALASVASNLPNSGGVISWFTGDNSLSAFAAELADFGPAMKAYAQSVGDIPDGVIESSANAAQAISAFASTLPNNGGLVSWFTGDNTLSAFATELTEFGPALMDYAKSVDGLKGDVVESSIAAATIISEFATNLPNSGGIASWFTGDNTLSKFGKQLAKFGPDLMDYAESVNGLKSDAVENSVNVAKIISEFATNLPNSGGVASWFTGDNTLSAFAKELTKFGPKLKKYAESVDGLNVDVVVNSMTAANAIAEFVKNLPNSGGIASWFTGDGSISDLAKELAKFGPKLKKYADSVEGLKVDAVENSANAVKIIAEFANNLPNSGGIASWFAGDNTLSKFGKQLAKFGPKLMEYAESVDGLSIDVVENSANAAEIISTFATKLPNSGGIASWFTGDNTLSKFGKQLAKFGPKLMEYAGSVDGLSVDVVENSVNAAEIISTFANKLPDSGGIASWFTGDNTLSKFGKQLAKFGPNLMEYAGSVDGLSADAVTNSITAAEVISTFANNLPDSGGIASWFSGDNTLSGFAKQLPEFGKHLAEYADAISGIEVSSLDAILPSLESLVAIGSDISNLNISSVDAFGESFANLAKNGIQSLTTSFSDGTQDVTDAIEKMLKAGLDKISNKESDFKRAGINIVNKLIAGINSKKSTISSSFNTSLSAAVSAIRGYYYSFRSAGDYLVQGFASGISSSTWRAEAAAKAAAAAAERAAKKELEQNSPSKKFYRIGEGTIEGLVNAMNDGRKAVYKSGASLAEASYRGTSEAIKKVAAAIDSDMDPNPTIRPVLDLTDVTDGFGQLSAMFSRKQAVRIGSSMAAGSVDVTENGNAPAIGNSFNFTQNNYSPKALSPAEIYRNTRNQFSKMKGWVNAR